MVVVVVGVDVVVVDDDDDDDVVVVVAAAAAVVVDVVVVVDDVVADAGKTISTKNKSVWFPCSTFDKNSSTKTNEKKVLKKQEKQSIDCC